MSGLKLILLIAVVAVLSSAITYQVTKPFPLHVIKPELDQVELVLSNGFIKDVCEKYLMSDLRNKSESKGEESLVRITSIEGFGFSIDEIYCAANVDVLQSINNDKVIKSENTTYFYSLSENRDLSLRQLTKQDIESAYKKYAEMNKS